MTMTIFGPDAGYTYSTGVVVAEPSLRHDGLLKGSLELNAGIVLWNTAFQGIPRTASVVTATFSAVIAEDVTGDADLALKLNAATFDTSATWLNRPAAAGSAVTVTVSSPVAGDTVDFVLTSPVAALIAAGDSPGFQLTRSDAGDPVKILLADSYMTVEWTAAGATPSGLSPNGVVGITKPLLSWAAPRDGVSARIQIDPSESGFGTPAWESGTVTIPAPEYDLALSTFPGLGGPDQWWRVAILGPSGGWQDFSDPVNMQAIELPDVTITGPSAAYPYVTDPSPTFTWDVSGAAQASYSVFVTTVGDGDKTKVWESGRIEGTEQQITMPAKDPDTGKVILKDRNEYRVWVKVWDDVDDRVAVPGADKFQQVAQVFTFTEVAGVPPIDYLLAYQRTEGEPVTRLEFGRLAGVPDMWAVWRDDQMIDEVDPADLDDNGAGGWLYDDWGSMANAEHDYVVEAVVNKSTSFAGPHALVTPVVVGKWLTSKDNDWSVWLHDVTGLGMTVTDQATEVQGLGQRNVTRRRTAQGYFAGTLEGLILSDDDRTADDYFLDLRRMAANSPTTIVTVHYANFSYPAVLGDVTPAPWVDVHGMEGALAVSIRVLQQDDWTIVDSLPPAADPTNPAPTFIETYSGFADTHVLIVGESTISAKTGTPTVHNTPAIYPDGEKVWSGGSITRPLLNSNQGTLMVVGMITSNTLSSSGSLFKLRNPAGANPADIRLRQFGTIDVVAFDATTPDASSLEWQKNIPFRCGLAYRWVEDASLGASMGHLTIDAWFNFGSTLEFPYPDSQFHVTYPSLAPVNFTEDSPQSSCYFTVVQEWPFAFQPYAYGDVPLQPTIPHGTVVEGTSVSSTTLNLSVYTGDAAPGDTISVNRSAASSMTSPTNTAIGPRGTYGYNKVTVSGLTANTGYYWQAVVNGTPTGTVCFAKTVQAANSAVTTKIAVGGCQQRAPSSAACFLDAASWGYEWFVHLGDDGYPNDLDTTLAKHEFWYATAMTDTGRGQLNQTGAVDKVISDHDVNQGPAAPKGNGSNFNDPVTAASLLAWADAIAAPMADVRSPKRGRYWSKQVGKVRYIYLDTRSVDRTDSLSLAKYVAGVYDPRTDVTSTMLGATQLLWLKAEIDAASLAGHLCCIFSDPGWNGLASLDGTDHIKTSDSDKWISYTFERDLISDYVVSSYAAHGKTPNAVIVHSDSHAIQWDQTHDKNNLTIVCAGPLDQNVHALTTFVDNYDFTYPSNADDEGRLPQDEMYQRLTFDAVSTPGSLIFTAVARNCTPRDVGSSPIDIVGGTCTQTFVL